MSQHPISNAESIAIVGGCGHVGLPLGIALALSGHQVTLIDRSTERVAGVRAGKMPFVERGGEEQLPQAISSGRLHATSSLIALAEAEAVVVTIGTPVDEFLDPSLRQFDATIGEILSLMRAGQLLVLRSTVFPGVTERLGQQLAQRGLQIDIAYCPERIAQAAALEELRKLPQIIGGLSDSAVQRAGRIFGSLGVTILEVTPTEAELSKLFANAYRYINFAISNQFYMIAEKFGCDFRRIHAAVRFEYPRLAGFAGAGLVGGPCLLKDTMQLAAFNHNGFALGQAAMMVNEGLPYVLVEQLKRQRDLRPLTAGILGMAFKGNCDDPRASLSYKLRKVLGLECARVLCTDPFIDDPSFTPLDEVVRQADVIFLGATHQEYRELKFRQPVIDPFGFLKPVTPPVRISV
jgi:UDP-N-acetyl-D-mannosaminuronic acid dehydrogenase